MNYHVINCDEGSGMLTDSLVRPEVRETWAMDVKLIKLVQIRAN